MKKILLATVALSTLAAAPAMAADLARPAPPPPPVAYKAPPPIYLYSWTGCYIGGKSYRRILVTEGVRRQRLEPAI